MGQRFVGEGVGGGRGVSRMGGAMGVVKGWGCELHFYVKIYKSNYDLNRFCEYS